MAKFDPKRALVAATPLLSLVALLSLFVVTVRQFVECRGGDCEPIAGNMTKVLAPDEPGARIAQDHDGEDVRRTKAIKTHERIALIFAGRMNFLFLTMSYISICAVALAIGIYVIGRSSVGVTNHPMKRVLAGVAVAAVAALCLYQYPQSYMSNFTPLIGATIQEDLPATHGLLVTANSFGFAVGLFLTLAICSVLYAPNAKVYPDGLKQISRQMKHLQRILYVATLMLVVGVLLIRSVYQWSLAFGLRDDDAIKAAETLFSVVLTIEGGCFTLILAVVYLPAVFILRKRAEDLMDLPESERDKAFEEHHLNFSFSKALPRLAAILGPLLAGPVGDFVSGLGAG
jgi:hypothetical protein